MKLYKIVALIILGSMVFSLRSIPREVAQKLISMIHDGDNQGLKNELTALQASGILDAQALSGCLKLALQQQNPSVAILQILVDFGADINRPMRFIENVQMRPLSFIVRHPNPSEEILQFITEHANTESLSEIVQNLTPLMNAVGRRDSVLIKLLLAQRHKFDINQIVVHTDPQTQTQTQMNALYLACTKAGNAEIIKLLLDAGANPRITLEQIVNARKTVMSCLHLLIKINDVEAFRVVFDYFIHNNISLNFFNVTNTTLLQAAVESMNLEIIQLLLPHVNPNIIPQGTNSLLNLIFQRYKENKKDKKNRKLAEEIIMLLIPHVRLDSTGYDGQPPLFAALFNGLPEHIVNLLVRHGADIHQVNAQGLNIVQSIAVTGYLPLLKRVLRMRVFHDRFNLNDVVSQGPFEGYNALTIALYQGHREMVNYLLELGVDVNQPPEHLPLLETIRRLDFGTFNRLLHQRTMNVNTVNDAHQNALFSVVTINESEAIRFAQALLDAGINVNALDVNGSSVLSAIVQLYLGHAGIPMPMRLITVLLLNGANPNLGTIYGGSLVNYLITHLNQVPDPQVFYLLKLFLWFGGSVSTHKERAALAHLLRGNRLIQAAALGDVDMVRQELLHEPNRLVIIEAFLMAVGQGNLGIVELMMRQFNYLDYMMAIPPEIIHPLAPQAPPLTFLELLKVLLQNNLQTHKKLADYFAEVLAKRKFLFIYRRDLGGITHGEPLPDNVRDLIFQKRLESDFPRWFAELVDDVYHRNRELYLEELKTIAPIKTSDKKSQEQIIGHKRPADEQPSVVPAERSVWQQMLETQVQIRQAKRQKVKPDNARILYFIEYALQHGEELTPHIMDALESLIENLNVLDTNILQRVPQLIQLAQHQIEILHQGGPYERHLRQIILWLKDIMEGAPTHDIPPGPAIYPSSR